MVKLDKILNDVLNAGIALFRTGEQTLNKTISDLQKSFDELKARGASDTSEEAQKLRSQLDEIIKNTDALRNKAEESYKETLEKIETNFKGVVQQVEKILPKNELDSLQKNINELLNTIREKMDKLKSKEKSETKTEDPAGTQKSE